MDARGGRILEFLKENSHLDLEVPDIAFNVKKSEKTVEAALKKFQQKGLVTARQNEFGRVYWYALPSAPITKILQTEELLPKSSGTETAGDDDEAVDLFSLPKKETRTASPAEKNDDQPVKNASRKTRTVKTPAKPQTDETAVKPKIEKTAAKPPETAVMEPTFEPAPPVEAPVVENKFVDVEEIPATKNGSGVLLQVAGLLVAVIAVILSINAIGRGGRITKQLSAVEKSIPKDVVATADLQTVKEQVAGIAALEEKITALTTVVDSLSNEIVKINEAKVKPVRRSTRRRR
ncbi:MAG: hypothetical protein JW863_07860 [Chitinispirillaceae bacterium]|nr:hypothetical protein [Chitinispirillaceae bacterium]